MRWSGNLCSSLAQLGGASRDPIAWRRIGGPLVATKAGITSAARLARPGFGVPDMRQGNRAVFDRVSSLIERMATRARTRIRESKGAHVIDVKPFDGNDRRNPGFVGQGV